MLHAIGRRTLHLTRMVNCEPFTRNSLDLPAQAPDSAGRDQCSGILSNCCANGDKGTAVVRLAPLHMPRYMALKCPACGEINARHQVSRSEYDPVAPQLPGGIVMAFVFVLSRKRRFHCDRCGELFDRTLSAPDSGWRCGSVLDLDRLRHIRAADERRQTVRESIRPEKCSPRPHGRR